MQSMATVSTAVVWVYFIEHVRILLSYNCCTSVAQVCANLQNSFILLQEFACTKIKHNKLFYCCFTFFGFLFYFMSSQMYENLHHVLTIFRECCPILIIIFAAVFGDELRRYKWQSFLLDVEVEK